MITIARARGMLIAILTTAAAARVWALNFGLPNIETRPDESSLVTLSSSMLYSSLNPHFFHWPSLELYAVAALYRLWWEVQHWRGIFHYKFEIGLALAQNPGAFFLVPRAVSAAAGVLTVWLVYRLTARLFDRTMALVAAFFLAVAFLHVRDSHFGVTDVPMTCLLVAALLPLQRLLVDPASRREWTRAGVLTGLAASTKYAGGMVAIVAAIVAALHWSNATRRGLLRYAIVATLAFLAGTPFAVLDFRTFLEGLQFDQAHLLTGHGVNLGRGWTYHALFTLRYGLGAPLFIAALAGGLVLAWRSWRQALFIGAFPLVYYALTGRGHTVFARYLIPIVPFLCIWAAAAVATVARWAARERSPATAIVTAAVSLAVAWPSIERVVAFDRLIGRPDTRVLARAWLDAARQPSEWVGEAPHIKVFPEIPSFGPDPMVHLARFDEGRAAFVSRDGVDVTPDWIIVGASPLSTYTIPPPGLIDLVTKSYALATTVPAATSAEPPEIFDQQDLFFVPFSDFSRRIRPGPEILIYRRIVHMK